MSARLSAMLNTGGAQSLQSQSKGAAFDADGTMILRTDELW